MVVDFPSWESLLRSVTIFCYAFFCVFRWSFYVVLHLICSIFILYSQSSIDFVIHLVRFWRFVSISSFCVLLCILLLLLWFIHQIIRPFHHVFCASCFLILRPIFIYCSRIMPPHNWYINMYTLSVLLWTNIFPYEQTSSVIGDQGLRVLGDCCIIHSLSVCDTNP